MQPENSSWVDPARIEGIFFPHGPQRPLRAVALHSQLFEPGDVEDYVTAGYMLRELSYLLNEKVGKAETIGGSGL